MAVTRSTVKKRDSQVDHSTNRSRELLNRLNTAKTSSRRSPREEDAGDVQMQDVEETPPASPVREDVAETTRVVRTQTGTIISQEGDRVMVDLGIESELRVMPEAEAKDNGFSRKIEEGNTKFNFKLHLDRLKTLKKEDGKAFDGNIAYLRRTAKYSGNKRTYLVKHARDKRELQCAQTELKSMLTTKDLEGFYDEKRASAGAVKAARANSQLVIPNGSQPGRDSDAKVTPQRAVDGNVKVSRSIEGASTPARRSWNAVKRETVIPESGNKSAQHFTIVAKHIASIHKGKEQAVFPKTYCILKDKDGKHSFMHWSEIEARQEAGSASFKQADHGKGIHPDVDRFSMQYLKAMGGLQLHEHRLEDVIVRKCGSVYFITVILQITSTSGKKAIQEFRDKAHYEYSGPIRCSLTSFLEAGGRYNAVRSILEETELGQEYGAQREKGSARLRSPTPQPDEEVKKMRSDLDVLMKAYQKLEVNHRALCSKFTALERHVSPLVAY